MDIAEPNPTLFKGSERRAQRQRKMYFYWTLPSRILPYSKVRKKTSSQSNTHEVRLYVHAQKKPSASNLNIENKKQTAFVKKIGARCAYWCEALDVQGTLKVEITAQRADEEKGLLKLRAVIFF